MKPTLSHCAASRGEDGDYKGDPHRGRFDPTANASAGTTNAIFRPPIVIATTRGAQKAPALLYDKRRLCSAGLQLSIKSRRMQVVGSEARGDKGRCNVQQVGSCINLSGFPVAIMYAGLLLTRRRLASSPV
ncbi:hypothetical protein EYF80_055050 [Liparis tanakae]|uniref:Uncharacterized protein n=1 Tax=Liparis tanakae TaxID=230148 RepID=A0A4Z2F0Q7_9TELE|nr:hypothetical protein EYF80_055050 [Liparis tanakae]